MKKLFVTLLTLLVLPALVGAFEVPARPTTFVSDYANMLSPEEKTELENKISAFEKATTNEIAVVTIPSLEGKDIADVAQQIFTTWGIGKVDKNNGVILLISLSDRQTRIQTGYGVEGDLTDLGTSYIQSELITPAFRDGLYAKGIGDAVDAMVASLGGADIVPEDYQQKSKSMPSNVVFIFGIFMLQGLIGFLSRSKAWWEGGIVGMLIGLGIGWFFGITFLILIPSVLLGLLLDYVVSKAGPSRGGFGGPHFWGGGGFGGGSSGGFGGFGGGMSGGGGSSGRW